MKTTRIRLTATMVFLAAATMISTTPALGQRRTSSSENKREVQTENRRSSNTSSRPAQKSTTKQNNEKKEVIKPSQNNRNTDIVRQQRTVERGNVEKPAERKSSSKPIGVEQTRPATRNEATNNRSVESREAVRNDPREANRSNENYRGGRIDENRRNERYTPSRDYRGSDNYWSERERPNFNNRDSREKHYWDRKWENYRWNERSWRDYYHGYEPYSFKNSKYYYHDPRYGHVIRRFVVKPKVFVYNRIPYYCYDGYFFTYHRGIGYILTDAPYGLTFHDLPFGFEKVWINGYMYFRFGNLFFEYDGFGYRLVFYPELFLAIR